MRGLLLGYGLMGALWIIVGGCACGACHGGENSRTPQALAASGLCNNGQPSNITRVDDLAMWQGNIEVVFTNPRCVARAINGYIAKPRWYNGTWHDGDFVTGAVPTVAGGTQTTSKTNSFCLYSDYARARDRPAGPYQRLAALIDTSTQGDRIFFSSFSFSNHDVSRLLCSAAKRGVQVNFAVAHKRGLINSLTACADTVSGVYLGEHSSRLHHMKFFIIERAAQHKIALAFGSANVSAGVVLHHENWNFLHLPKHSYFVQNHLCLRKALLSDTLGQDIAKFRSELRSCRQQIAAPASSRVVTYFVPELADETTSEGRRFLEALLAEIRSPATTAVAMMVHQFTLEPLMQALRERLATDRQFRFRLLSEDDHYWRNTFGGSYWRNSSDGPLRYQFDDFRRLCRDRCLDPGQYRAHVGLVESFPEQAALRFMQTNHFQGLLHHNKVMLFYQRDGSVRVCTGAGNFTQAAFSDNSENFYLLDLPELGQAYATQFDYMWRELASTREEMPISWRVDWDGLRENFAALPMRVGP